jgi:cytochrome P450
MEKNMTNRPYHNEGTAQSSFFGPDFFSNPYPYLAQMRKIGPIFPVSGSSGRQVWMVTQFNEAVQVLKDQRFSVDPFRSRRMFARQSGMPAQPGFILEGSMITVDEPDHSRLRTLVSKAFTPRYIEELRPRIQSLADDLLDRVQDQGEMDLISDFAYPLPINVISEMLGIPKEGRQKIREWSAVIATNEEDPMRGEKLDSFANYVKNLVAQKRGEPQDDLISKLVQLEETGDHLNENELLSMVALLIFAGHETTSNLIGNGALTLLDHPEQLERLKSNPNLIPTAVEELLRFCGPVISPAPRHALEDVQVGYQLIHQGDIVMVMIASADRDSGQFSSSEDLDVARNLNRHIAFGQGIHYCLGAPLARLEGEIAFATLLRRMPDIHLNVPRESITWNSSMVLRGTKKLPVAF